jgi:hypothetical protein
MRYVLATRFFEMRDLQHAGVCCCFGGKQMPDKFFFFSFPLVLGDSLGRFTFDYTTGH